MTQAPPPPRPVAPVRHQYTVEVNREALGGATYTLLKDGQPVGTPVHGGWDDTTPWANKTYTVSTAAGVLLA